MNPMVQKSVRLWRPQVLLHHGIFLLSGCTPFFYLRHSILSTWFHASRSVFLLCSHNQLEKDKERQWYGGKDKLTTNKQALYRDAVLIVGHWWLCRPEVLTSRPKSRISDCGQLPFKLCFVAFAVRVFVSARIMWSRMYIHQETFST